MAVVTDKKIQHSSNGTTVDYYEPDIVSATDYAPFGSPLPGRNYQSNQYRYGFNGKENDNEIKGQGNQQDYGMRIYDPRLSRFLSVDPVSPKYPDLTPYQFASNNPIKFIDIDGLERMNPAAKQPTGITVLGNATIPTGGIIDEKHFIKAGNYRLHGVTNSEGKQWWIARKPEAGGYSDDFIVGTDAVSTFMTLSGKAEWLAYWNHKAEANGGGLKGAFKAAWSPQNILAGAMIGLGGILSLESKISARLNSAETVNKLFKDAQLSAPYKAGTTIAELEAPTNLSLVRLSGANNVEGSWYTTANEIKGLTPAQLQNRFSLKYEPTSVTPVTIEKGATIRIGETAPVENFGTQGGGFQIEKLKGIEKKNDE